MLPQRPITHDDEFSIGNFVEHPRIRFDQYTHAFLLDQPAHVQNSPASLGNGKSAGLEQGAIDADVVHEDTLGGNAEIDGALADRFADGDKIRMRGSGHCDESVRIARLGGAGRATLPDFLVHGDVIPVQRHDHRQPEAPCNRPEFHRFGTEMNVRQRRARALQLPHKMRVRQIEAFEHPLISRG